MTENMKRKRYYQLNHTFDPCRKMLYMFPFVSPKNVLHLEVK